MNSENFQNFHFWARIVIFEGKSKKMITRVHSLIFEFPENGHSYNPYPWILKKIQKPKTELSSFLEKIQRKLKKNRAIFSKNFKKHLLGEFVKIREYSLVIIFF